MSSPPPPPLTSSSSSSRFLQAFNGQGTRLVVLVSVPLILVSLVLFALDSRSNTSWFSSPDLDSSGGGSSVVAFSAYSPSSSAVPVDGGDGDDDGASVDQLSFLGSPSAPPLPRVGSDAGGGGGEGGDSDGVKEHAYFPPMAAPPTTPASEPAKPPSRAITKRDAKLEKLELGLARARAAIKEAFRNSANNSLLLPDDDFVPQGPSYRNAHAFQRSYLEMEKLFKVYVYQEGEPPLFHDGPCRSIYSSEGRFIHSMDVDTRFRTKDPAQAHVFFLPFSVVKMVKFIYKYKSYDISPITRTVADYIDVVSSRYPYWNRSLGLDHLMLSCHDWGPHVSKAIPELYNNSIRALCNANTSEGFRPSKDVSLLEINLRTDKMEEMMGGPSASRRPILAFFAGGMHGPVRPLLLEAWKGKDPDVQVHEYLPKGVSYYEQMRRSKFCLCPSGYEVASPRIVEAIYLGCVPVTINDHYVLPFSDVLNWKAFSVQVAVEDIPNLKRILTAISSRQYIRMQRRVAVVRRHFVVNSPPRRFDMFHMILHSVWLRRLNVRVHDQAVE